MDGMNGVDALNFDKNQILNDQIDPVSKLNFLSLENYRQPDLACHFKAVLSEVMGEAALVNTFKQPRSKHRVDVHCRRNDRTGNLIDPQGVRGEISSSHFQTDTTQTEVYPVIPCVLWVKDFGFGSDLNP
jgi:hypothetical protein